MKLIGLTGSIASGKSTVAELLKEKGALVIDADQIARDVIEPGLRAYQQIVAYFGPAILRPDRTVDRQKLANIVFNDSEARAMLNAIVHPPVIHEIDRLLSDYEKQYGDGQIVVLDVPLLIEVGYHNRCDLIVIVDANEDTRIERLIGKGLTRNDAESRIEAQAGKDALKERADVVIENNGTLEELKELVDDLWKRINIG